MQLRHLTLAILTTTLFGSAALADPFHHHGGFNQPRFSFSITSGYATPWPQPYGYGFHDHWRRPPMGFMPIGYHHSFYQPHYGSWWVTPRVYEVMEYTAPGRQVTLNENGDDGVYAVTPGRARPTQDGRYCREYQAKVMVSGRLQDSYGQACRQPDGSWEIVS